MDHPYQRRVQFADTDAAGVVHFSRLLCYVEEAEHNLLDQLGIPLMADGGWPRVSVSCDYLAPVRMGQDVEVLVNPVKVGRSSVVWSFALSVAGATVARGEMKTVRVDAGGQPVELESSWRALLESSGT